MIRQAESKPVADRGVPGQVPIAAKQTGEVRARWAWVEPMVWTDRMLEALENGVKGGVWFSLIDKVYATNNLYSAAAKVCGNKGGAGVDHQTVEMFEKRRHMDLKRLECGLRDGSYRPQAIRRAWIPKPGSKEKRPLGIPTVRDRVAQTALRNVLEPIFERDFAEHSYGFRPGRGCHDALKRVNELMEHGSTWVVDADLKSYFDTIPQDRLMELVRAKVADGRVLALLELYLKQKVLDQMREWTPERGTPQGAVISPLLSNIYLNPLDHMMKERGYEMVRYADDFVILCKTETEAKQALEEVREWTAQAGLTLHPEKTCIVDATQRGGFDFLGYHFERGYKWPRKKSIGKFREGVRKETRRTNGHSMAVIISRLNPKLRGWFAYFKNSSKPIFSDLDKWVRMRLRSILRKRHRGRGRGRGFDHFRWPNRYFADQGLFSFVTTCDASLQSARR